MGAAIGKVSESRLEFRDAVDIERVERVSNGVAGESNDVSKGGGGGGIPCCLLFVLPACDLRGRAVCAMCSSMLS